MPPPLPATAAVFPGKRGPRPQGHPPARPGRPRRGRRPGDRPRGGELRADVLSRPAGPSEALAGEPRAFGGGGRGGPGGSRAVVEGNGGGGGEVEGGRAVSAGSGSVLRRVSGPGDSPL